MTIPTLLIDGYGFIFRAYHVQPPLTSPAGEPVGALYGMTSMLMKLISDFKPVKCAIVFDGSGKNFRHELYPEYKAHRPPVPEELRLQFPLIRTLATALGFPILEKPNVEADDVIATVACRLSKAGEKVVIVSSDKDLMQLICDNVRMYDPLKAKYIDDTAVREKFGVGPDRVRDALALIGDSSDNIPGAPGIGPKGAADLIAQFGSLHEILAGFENIKQDKKRAIIRDYTEQIKLSWDLIGLKSDLDIENNGALNWHGPDRTILSNFIARYGFKSLIVRAEKLFGMDLEKIAEPDSLEPDDTSSETLPVQSTILDSTLELEKLMALADKKGILAICLDNEDRLYITVEDKQSFSIYLGSTDSEAQSDLFSENKSKLDLTSLWKILGDQSVKKITHDVKRLWHNILLAPNNTISQLNMGNLISELPQRALVREDSEYLQKITYADVNFRNWYNNIFGFEDLALMQYATSAGMAQASTHDFLSKHKLIAHYNILLKELKTHKALSLYYDIDLPLAKVLYNMERAGVKIDQSKLASMSEKFEQEIKTLEIQIHQMAGVDFNIGSPKQLGEILFEKMQLPTGKVSSKTKTYSTGAEVLESLSEAGFEIANLILRWREISKLKNTYTDSLPKKIDLKTGRVHTNFVQNLTTTGRLSSIDPNLQNIPIRTKEGALIRTAFVVSPGNKLISADYSQIELRLLAHVADVPHLRDAFKNGEDIHRATASQVFGISKEDVTPELRRKAKAVNFGMIYGISAFGLAKQLNIGRKEAAEIQDKYFKEYPGIKQYMEQTRIFAKEHGYVENMFGRKCMLPMINDRNFAMRSFAERAAINAPLQGANADIIKLAMIEINKKFTEIGLKAQMILQVHDELVFEVPENEVPQVVELVKKIMQNIVQLCVPLVVDVGVADNWADA